MPRLLVFAPCERVILGQDQTASLIVVIQELRFHGPFDKPIEPNAAAVIQLSMFSQWYKLPEDGEKTFEERIVFGGSDGDAVFEVYGEFQMTRPVHRVIATLRLLPILKPGEYHFRLFLREKGESEWSSALADYPVTIAHEMVPQPQA